MDLLHRIIAMNGTKPARVECRTCMGHHAYRKPKNAPPEPKAPRASRATSASPRSTTPRASGSASARAQAAALTERQREAEWEKRIGGQPFAAFKPYRASQTFEAGELIRHFKFGDGFIARVIDKQKVEVMFKDGPRTLAQALEP